MNNHQIATPEMMLEDARSYIMFFHETGGKLSAYIGLHLLQSGRKLFYTHSSNPFQTGEMGSVEEEALGFVEGLGGLLDTIDFTKMSSEEKNRWIENQDLFIEKPEPESPAEEKAEETEQEKASSVQPEPQAPQTPSFAPESASEMQLPPQMQPAPPTRYAPQAPQQPVPPETSTPQTPPVPPVQEAPLADVDEMRTKPNSRAARRTASPTAPPKGTQGILQEAIKAGVVKPPKQSMKKEAQSAVGVVSRDREALARLLTSF